MGKTNGKTNMEWQHHEVHLTGKISVKSKPCPECGNDRFHRKGCKYGMLEATVACMTDSYGEMRIRLIRGYLALQAIHCSIKQLEPAIKKVGMKPYKRLVKAMAAYLPNMVTPSTKGKARK